MERRFCKQCGKELLLKDFHKKYGYKNNNLEQIKEFLNK